MSMNGQMETKLGKVTIDPEVIALYAGSVAVECFWNRGHGCCQYEGRTGKIIEERLPDTWY